MTSDVPQPPSRESLYPETHRAAGWQDPAHSVDPQAAQRRTNRRRGLIAGGIAVVVIAGVAWAGLEVGKQVGTEVPVITSADGDTINAIQAEPGMCLEDIGKDGAVARVVAVPCTEPHRAEVVASYQFTVTDFPGTDAARSEMIDYCGRVIQPGFSESSMFQPGDWDAGVRWVAWAPTAESWGVDDQTGVCVAYRDGDMVGSFVGGTVTFSD